MKPKPASFSLLPFSKSVFQSFCSRLLFIIEVSCILRGKKGDISLTGPLGSFSLSIFFETMLLICVFELILNPSFFVNKNSLFKCPVSFEQKGNENFENFGLDINTSYFHLRLQLSCMATCRRKLMHSFSLTALEKQHPQWWPPRA